MNRTLTATCVVFALIIIGTVAGFFWRLRSSPEGKHAEPLPPTVAEAFDYLPRPDEAVKLDPYTREVVELLRELLPSRQNKPWPTRIVSERDAVNDDKRTLLLRLEKALKIEALALADGVAITIADKTGDKPASWVVGQKDARGGYRPFTTPAEARSAFGSLQGLQGVVMPGADATANPLLSGLALEFDVASASVADLPNTPEGAICFEIALRSGVNQVEMTKVGGNWKIVRVQAIP